LGLFLALPNFKRPQDKIPGAATACRGS